MTVRAALAALALVVSLAAVPFRTGAEPQPPDPEVTALVARVASAYAATTDGLIGVRSESDLRIDAPVFRKTIHDDAWFVFRDGTLAQSSKPPDPRQPPLHDPYRAAYLAEYRYAFVACPTCAADTVAIAFESPARDAFHAHGSLVVQRATARIISSSETPYKLPWPTTSGSLEATWGAVGGGWFPIAVTGEFVGRIGFFVGHAHFRQTLSAYARYGTLDAATQALTAASPAER